MKIWVGASRVSCNAFFIVYYHPLKRFFCPWGGRKRSNLAGAVFASSCCCCSQRKASKIQVFSRLLPALLRRTSGLGAQLRLSLEICSWEISGQEQVLGQELKAVLELPMKRMVLQRSASRFLAANVNSKDSNTVLPAQLVLFLWGLIQLTETVEGDWFT